MDVRGATVETLALFCETEYVGAVDGQRYHGFGRVALANHTEYCGNFVQGRMDGYGTIAWDDGLKYVGQWKDNVAVGHGCLTWPNGAQYVGEVSNGRRHGHGVHSMGTIVYKGEWHDGRRHGFGTQSCPSSQYSGEWVDGKRHGWGTIRFSNGNKYEGCWVNDRMEGQGVMLWLTKQQSTDVILTTQGKDSGVKEARRLVQNIGTIAPGPLGPFTPSVLNSADAFDRYTGDFRNNMPHGQGQLEVYFHTGSARENPFDCHNQYVGGFREGLRDGFGIQTYADGSQYEGDWSKNMKHGKGAIVHLDGTRDEVEMDSDAPRSKVVRACEAVSFAIEDNLHIEDLTPNVKERDSLRHLATRYKNVLRHLYICYGKIYLPIDFDAVISRVFERNEKTPGIHWQVRPDIAHVAIPPGTTPHERNCLITASMSKAAATLADKAVTVGQEAVETTITQFTANDRPAAVVESDMVIGDSFTQTPRSSQSHSQPGSPSPIRRLRAATPLEGFNREFLQQQVKIPPPPVRSAKQAELTRTKLHWLLRDALVLDVHFTATSANDVIATAFGQDAQASVVSEVMRPHDCGSQPVTFKQFIECLIRIAEVKLSSTGVYFVKSGLKKMSLPDRFHYLIEYFLVPLCDTLREIDSQKLLQNMLGFDPFVAEPAEGNATLEEFKKTVHRSLKESALPSQLTKGRLRPTPTVADLSEAAVVDSSSQGDHEFILATQEEHFNMEITRKVTMSCPPQGRHGEATLEKWEVSVSSNLGTRRVHYLYVHLVEGSHIFGGVTAAYNIHRDASSAITFPSRVLTSHLPLADILEKDIALLYRVFEQCCKEMNHRSTLMKILRLFQRQRLLAPSTKPRKAVDQFFEVLLKKEFASLEGRDLSTLVPSAAFERHQTFKPEILEEPAAKQILKQFPDFAEVVQAEIRRCRNERDQSHLFDHIGVPLGHGLWWLMAADVTLSFSSFVSIVLELARFTFPSVPLEEALKKTLARLAEPPRAVTPKKRTQEVALPPSKVDKLLPRKVAPQRPATADRTKSAAKKPAGKK